MEARLRALVAAHGVFTRKDAIALGYHDHAIAELVKAGDWVRVRRGAYVLGSQWAAMTQSERYAALCRAALRQSRTEVVLSHLSSANEYATPLWECDLTKVHLTRLDARAGRAEAGIVQHRGVVTEGDVVTAEDGTRRMSATRTALELTTLLDVEHALVEIDFLLHEGLTTIKDLHARYAAMTHWPRTLATDLVLRMADGRSESVGETRTRFLCWSQHLPAPVPNFPIHNALGVEIARVDLAWPALRVFLEFDGRVKYEGRRRKGESVVDCVLREKQRESLICEITGWRCIRITWADLYRPAEVAARIRALFAPAAA
ncbi:type IV toxin-antitoxin system AbiEi family antitoxin domain-containing protein [Nocardioides pinisoli]|uniref:Type IV toxin-antitoxin system AbiEi family antitoxin domain-containing protein n=1 Tax=Nocardioides pinisoli TaxID=2950279 RepID=A0ABT1L170_9ACTN|nr:type IV toxin-antitoxin system AbiEi family antitoxin domain-containing protein [Nocardioides pinisoli]MCP3423763.1 type IV toxin-antitoxin system AbiEi family antitoxin domain-containing protein [Nocardioides pinisoli]